MTDSQLYQILHKDTAPNQVAILYEKGLMTRDIRYLTPSQVGGQMGAAKGIATDAGQDSGVHLKSDGVTLTKSMAEHAHVRLGSSNDKNCFLSVVEVSGTSEPMLGTSISQIAAHLCDIRAHSVYKSAECAVQKVYARIQKKLKELRPAPDTDYLIEFTAKATNRRFQLTKHMEEPTGMKRIDLQILETYNYMYKERA